MIALIHVLCGIAALAGSHAFVENQEQLLMPIAEISKSITNNVHSRIINPANPVNGAKESHALIFIFSNEQLLGWIGIGSLISDRHILAHASGIMNFNQWIVIYNQAQNNVTTNTAVFHPDFVPSTRENDIGIITLETPLDLSGCVKPIQLPPIEIQLPMYHEQIEVIGFSGTNRNSLFSNSLSYGFMRITEMTRCGTYFEVLNDETQFCAADDVRFSSLCLGDLGAGALSHYRGEQILVGIASMLTSNCDGGYPMIFTKVSSYREWIYQLSGI